MLHVLKLCDLALLVSFLLLRMLLPLLIHSGNEITSSDDVQARGYVQHWYIHMDPAPKPREDGILCPILKKNNPPTCPNRAYSITYKYHKLA